MIGNGTSRRDHRMYLLPREPGSEEVEEPSMFLAGENGNRIVLGIIVGLALVSFVGLDSLFALFP